MSHKLSANKRLLNTASDVTAIAIWHPFKLMPGSQTFNAAVQPIDVEQLTVAPTAKLVKPMPMKQLPEAAVQQAHPLAEDVAPVLPLLALPAPSAAPAAIGIECTAMQQREEELEHHSVAFLHQQRPRMPTQVTAETEVESVVAFTQAFCQHTAAFLSSVADSYDNDTVR